MNRLDEYDREKLRNARNIINEVADYNYIPSSSLSKRLDTILNKIDWLLEEYNKGG